MSSPSEARRNVEPNTLSESALELVAARFRLLGEPMRLRLLHTLMSGERSVTQLVEATGAGQANVSKHLAVLADAGMVARRKAGLNVFYSIADPSLFTLCDLVCKRLQERFADQTNVLATGQLTSTPPPKLARPRKPKRSRRSPAPCVPLAGPEVSAPPVPAPGPFSIDFD